MEQDGPALKSSRLANKYPAGWSVPGLVPKRKYTVTEKVGRPKGRKVGLVLEHHAVAGFERLAPLIYHSTPMYTHILALSSHAGRAGEEEARQQLQKERSRQSAGARWPRTCRSICRAVWPAQTVRVG